MGMFPSARPASGGRESSDLLWFATNIRGLTSPARPESTHQSIAVIALIVIRAED